MQELRAELEERALKEVLTSEQKSKLDKLTGKSFSPKVPDYYEQMLRQQLPPSKTSNLLQGIGRAVERFKKDFQEDDKYKKKIKVHGQLALAWLRSPSRLEPFFWPDGNATRVAAGRFRFRCRTAISGFPVLWLSPGNALFP